MVLQDPDTILFLLLFFFFFSLFSFCCSDWVVSVVLFLSFYFIYLFIFGSAGSSLLCKLLSRCHAWASRCRGFPCCRAQALGCAGFRSCGIWAPQVQLPGSGAQAQQLVAHKAQLLVGSPQIRDQTPVSCIGRHVLFHWATREPLLFCWEVHSFLIFSCHSLRFIACMYVWMNPIHWDYCIFQF